MNADSWAGRLFGSAGLPSERSGGNSACRPAARSWKICSGRPRSFSRWLPRSASAAPGGSPSRTSTAAACDTSTCPPYPVPATRAARCTSRPTTPEAVRTASPQWMPIRTRTRSPARPRLVLDGLLHFQRRRHASPRRGERREERIPLRIDLPTVVRGQRRPDQRMMTGQHLRVDIVPQPPEQRRRALNVGEQERESLHPSSVEGRARRRQLPPGTPSRQTPAPGWARLLTGSLTTCTAGTDRYPLAIPERGIRGGPAAKRLRSDRHADSALGLLALRNVRRAM
jgi:hypothetical protein